ncbi:MAG: S46 family peptidase [Ignavibacteriae bacterium]|nr:S46 family peptidase [Ignavibacteriota bacterium]
MMNKRIFFFFLLLFSITPSFSKDEGMWMPNQLAKLPWSEMKQRGLELSLEQIYSETTPSMKDGIVLLNDGTGSFVSSNGLILTNYHVTLAALQSVSNAKQDFIKNGYTARKMEEEIPVPSYTAKILLSMKEVTEQVLSVVNETMTYEQRANAIKSKSAEIEESAKGTSDYECHVVSTFFGLKYYLYTYEVLRDIRVVVSPPSSIGAFGGEEDNWMWPRHTGDFAFMRAYVSPDGKASQYAITNVPYKPKTFFPISTQGYQEGTFAMVMGFPSLTLRQMASPGIQAAKDINLPYLLELTNEQLDILHRAAEENPINAISYAVKIQTLENTSKYIEGTLKAVKKADVVKYRQNEELELWDYIFADSILSEKYGTVMIDLDTAYTLYRSFSKKQIAVTQFIGIIQALRVASVFKDYANSFGEKEQPNPTYKNNLTNFFKSTFKNTDLEVDKKLFKILLKAAAELPDDQQIEAIKKIYGEKKFKERDSLIDKYVDNLYKNSQVANAEKCEKFIEQTSKKILADNFVKFAIALDKETKAVQEELNTLDARISTLLRLYVEVKLKWKGTEQYPDANRTLRFSYGGVKLYTPRNSVLYNYYTTFGGMMEKEDVENDIFSVPPHLHSLWVNKNLSYTEPATNDVPLAFITNTDISGGNSGSPMLNGKGELIGVAFDGNWEGMAGDYLYQEQYNRTISVDARFILFYLDKYTGAQNILNELTIK